MSNTTSRSAPVSQKERVTSLDLIRGIAILGILPMNALTWGFSDFAGYSNVRAVGTEQPFDWVIGIASKLFIELPSESNDCVGSSRGDASSIGWFVPGKALP